MFVCFCFALGQGQALRGRLVRVEVDPKQVGGQHGVSDAPRNREVRNGSLEIHTKLRKIKLGLGPKSGAFASILSLWGTLPLFQGSSEMVCKRAALQILFQPCQEIYRAFSVPCASSCNPKVVLHHTKPSSCRDGGTQWRASTHRDDQAVIMALRPRLIKHPQLCMLG